MKRSRLLLAIVLVLMVVPEPVKAAGSLGVWTQSTSYKVQPTTTPGAGTSIAMEGAQDSYQDFQIIVRAGATALSGVNVTGGTLSDGNGHSIASTNLTFFFEQMIDFTGVSAINGSQPAPAQSPTHDGLVPDPLVPLIDPYSGRPAGAPFSVAANTNQPVWMDAYIPKGTPAGTYTGSVTVSATGQSSVAVPVSLIVWSFALPDQRVITAHFKMSTNDIVNYHHGTYACSGSSCWMDWNAVQARTVVKRYEELAHDSRIDVGQNFITPPTSAGTCSPPTDWTAWDAAMTPYMNGSYFSDGVPSSYFDVPFTPGASWGAEAQCTQAQYTALAAAWAAHLKAKGWFNQAIVYALDEPSPSSYPAIAQDSQWMQLGDPSWKNRIMDTTEARTSTVATLNPALGIYTICLPCYDNWWDSTAGNYGRATWPSLFAQGIKLWLYTSNGDGPPYAAYATNTLLGLEPRIVSWGSWFENASGFLYWDTTDWDPANTWGPNIMYGKTGDGVLIYPGNHDGLLAPQGSPSNVAIDGPIPSYRLKVIRDGMQDWALFILAQQHGLDSYTRSQVAQVYGQLGGCTWSGCAPVNGKFFWLSDDTLISQIRHNVATAIMNSGPGPTATPTAVSSATPTSTATKTPSTPGTASKTPTAAASVQATVTATRTRTVTATPTVTATQTHIAAGTPTRTPVRRGGGTATRTPVTLRTVTATITATVTVTVTATLTATPRRGWR